MTLQIRYALLSVPLLALACNLSTVTEVEPLAAPTEIQVDRAPVATLPAQVALPPAAPKSQPSLEVPLPAYDPIAWRLSHGLLEGPVGRMLLQPPEATVGTLTTFHARDAESESGFRQVEAELLYQNDVVSMWVERGLEVDWGLLAVAADRFAFEIVPTVRDLFGEEWSPGVDNDPRLSILHVASLAGAAGEYSAADQYLTEVEPYSNQREMFYISMAEFEAGDDDYMSTLAHEFQHMAQWHNDPSESTWLDEGLAQLAERIAGFDSVATHSSFLGHTDTQLNAWPDNAKENLPNYGASYLFSLYLWERFGDDLIRELARHPEDGMAAARQALAGRGVDVDQIFGEWTVANFVGGSDSVYGYARETLRPACPREQISKLPQTIERSLPQYSAQYLSFEGSGQVELGFNGNSRVGPIPDIAARGTHYWWSNRGDNIHSTLTRAFDLTGLQSASLVFQTWHDTEPYLDNGYVTISTDGGLNWEFLDSPGMLFDSELDYGPNFTGVSGSSAQPEWISERVDLTDYAGREVLIRFEYLTQSPYSGYGWAVDDIAVPELDYWHDAETENDGWIAEGFTRTRQTVDQSWAVHLVKAGEITKLEISEEGTGTTRFSLGLGTERETAILVVAAMAPRTKVQAEYKLNVGGTASLVPGPDASAQSAAFYDDFSNECSGWAIDDSAELAYGYDGGTFYIDLPQPELVALSTAGVSFSDAIINVGTRQVSSAGDNSWGVICRYIDFNNYYGFEISEDQHYTIYAFIQGEYTPLVDWTRLGSVAIGEGAQNRLTVACIGDRLSLSLHGNEVASTHHSTFTSGDIGLTASTYEGRGARVLFDDLRVNRPDYETVAGVLYFEDFEDPGSGWEADRDPESAVGYDSGRYFIDVTVPNRVAWSSADQEFGDLVVEVDTQLENPTQDNSWGVICRYRDPENQYGFEIGSDGLYVIYAVLEGEYVPLTDWTYSDAISTRVGATNHLRASCVGNTLSLSVNGVNLAEVQDSTLSSGDVALLAATYQSGGSRVSFDNLVVRAP